MIPGDSSIYLFIYLYQDPIQQVPIPASKQAKSNGKPHPSSISHHRLSFQHTHHNHNHNHTTIRKAPNPKDPQSPVLPLPSSSPLIPFRSVLSLYTQVFAAPRLEEFFRPRASSHRLIIILVRISVLNLKYRGSTHKYGGEGGKDSPSETNYIQDYGKVAYDGLTSKTAQFFARLEEVDRMLVAQRGLQLRERDVLTEDNDGLKYLMRFSLQPISPS